jgi:hypothetical protein
MLEVQLYIGSDRVDLFKDETISITESIKNARDISKVFTTFSKQFTVPASKNNNKIFKHYYTTTNFDARVKKDARIEISGATFKRGKLKLDGVDMRNNSPYAYRVTFYGAIVDLKDILGEDKLPSLTDLDIDKSYSAADVKTALTSAVDTDGTTIPLITHTQRLYYDSARSSEQSGNLHDAGINQGVKFDQLKYAIRLDKILAAIESEYPSINFASGSFFDPAQNTDITKLFMWCHRKKGGLDLTVNPIFNLVDGFNPSENVNSTVLKVESPDDHIVFVEEAVSQMDQLFFSTTTSNTSATYDVIIYRDTGSGFEVFQEQPSVSGSIEIQIIDTFIDGYRYYAAIRTFEEPITFSGFEWSANYAGGSDSFLEGSKTFAQSFFFNIAENLPEMKIIDFLSALFKMFNLVAYIDGNDDVYVEPLDDFYDTGEVDITKYVDINKSQVNAALPYREIFFKYADTGTILAEQHLQEISQVEWGGVEYTDAANLSGEIYKMEPDFHHAKYEKLIDVGNGIDDTGIQVGYFVDDNEESYLGIPLIMYIDRKQGNYNIVFLERNSRSSITTSQSINMPSNTLDIDDETSENIHFNAELSEYTNTAATETLFKRFYQSYIENIFNANTRLLKVSAYLPAGELLRLQLSNIIVINNNKYRINSFQSNLQSGKTDFELINYYD